MIAATLLATASSWLLGVLAAAVLWPRKGPLISELPLLLSLGLGMGLGFTSVTYLAATLISDHPASVSAGLELLLDVAMAWRLWRRPQPLDRLEIAPRRQPALLVAVAASVFFQACLVSVVVAMRAGATEPFGSWDGWAIWNLHARFIFRGGRAWPSLLAAPPLAWSHSDYPLLVPASVARAWAFAGRDAAWVSELVSLMFGIATVGLLVAATMRLRARFVGFVGGLVLLGTPFFVTFSSNEHADIPVGFFMLAAVVLIALWNLRPEAPGLSALVGIAAGMAAWTKNEGLLFALVVALAWGAYLLFNRSRRSSLAFWAGLALGLFPVLYFKIALAPPNDLMANRPGQHLGRALDLSRHRLIAAALWRDAAKFGQWRLAPFFALALPLFGRFWRRLNRSEWIAGAVIALTMSGYYGVYLLTSQDLKWQLEFSLVRLLLQLWPAVVFLWCLAAGSKEPPAPPARVGSAARPSIRLAILGLINAVFAGVVLGAFDRQLAPNEVAARHIGSASVSALVGDGWYGREADRRHTWMWSKGAAALWLRVRARQATTPVTLRFGLRGLGIRRISARIGGRIVWRQSVGEKLCAVEIAGLTLPAGTTEIDFATDEPGVMESANPDARVLAYAVYDFRLD